MNAERGPIIYWVGDDRDEGGWYWQAIEGTKPVGEPVGPFVTKAHARVDYEAREQPAEIGS